MEDNLTKIKLPKQSTAKEPGELIISAKNVSKKFCRHLKRSMAYGIADLSKNLIGIKPEYGKLKKDEFWALDDINFELRKGEVLGLVGLNGCGKSTLLRVLTGIFPPDKGEIVIKGRVGALIAVGAGFHPHMTGRENVYLNGTILGMSRAEIDSKYEAIVEFAEIGEFIDSPVSTYSSGMRVRLGFAIAVQINPDVLLIDEVLAVGDASFRYKCTNELDKLLENTAVVYVSHNLAEVVRMCSKVMVMDKGKALYLDTDVPKGIDFYMKKLQPTECTISENGKADIHNVRIYTDENKEIDGILQVEYLSDLYFEVACSFATEVKNVEMHINIASRQMGAVAQTISNCCDFDIPNKGKRVTIKVKFPRIQFNSGRFSYSIKLINADSKEIIYIYRQVGEFQVVGYPMHISPMQVRAEWDYVE